MEGRRGSGGPGPDGADAGSVSGAPHSTAHESPDRGASPAAFGLPSAIDDRACLRVTIDGRPNDVRRALCHIVSVLSAQGLSNEDCERAEVVLAEIMNNVVEHAFHGQNSAAFSVQIDFRNTALVVSVEDDGAPMPDLILPSGAAHDLTVALHDLPEGGFGWLLIRELTDDLRYEYRKGRNRLTFQLQTSARNRGA